MRLKEFFIAVFLFLRICAFSQSIDRDAFFSACGNNVASGAIQLQSNIGELIVETSIDPQAILTQGFVQPDSLLITTSIDHNIIFSEGSAFPNPVTNVLTVELVVCKEMNLNVEMYDLLGEKYTIPNSYKYVHNTWSFKLELSSLNSGLYFVKVFSSDNSYSKTFKINKI